MEEKMRKPWIIVTGLLLVCNSVYAQLPDAHRQHMGHMSFLASEQDWAKQRVDKSPRHQEWVKVKNGERMVNSFLVFPEVKSKATAVIVIHEIFGLSDWIRSLTDQLAEAGYIAIAPDLLTGLGANGGGTAGFTDRTGVTQAVQGLPPDQVTADLNAVANLLGGVDTLGQVDAVFCALRR